MHPYGNPHYMLDPVLAKTAVANIYNALVEFAPQHKAEFTRNRNAYLARLNAKIAEWEKAARPIRGVKFVSYHEHWPYFAARFGMNYFGTIELKPGVDPTPRHIQELVTAMKADHVPVVVREPQFPEKVPKRIAEQAGARHDNAAHHAGRRAAHGNVHQDDGLHRSYDGPAAQAKK